MDTSLQSLLAKNLDLYRCTLMPTRNRTRLDSGGTFTAALGSDEVLFRAAERSQVLPPNSAGRPPLGKTKGVTGVMARGI